MKEISKRGTIRLCSFSVALVMALSVGCALYYNEAQRYRRQLEATYLRGIGELSSYMTDITNNLSKGIYAGTPEQLSQLSSTLWRDAGAAKAALSTIPAATLHLDDSYRFLSQVGDYSMSLSKKVSSGGVLSEKEITTLESLLSYAQSLSRAVYDIENKLRSGEISVNALEEAAAPPVENGAAQSQGDPDAQGVFDEAGEIEPYGTLIYDGPFSDHMLEISPRMTQNAEFVRMEDAKLLAQRAAGTSNIEYRYEEHSPMASYCFEGAGISLGITEQGGYLTYLENGRAIGASAITPREAVETGMKYLSLVEVDGMYPTYFETANGICTINYAYIDNGVTCYPDLIKVGVALDNGQVVSYDARGFLVNHHERLPQSPKITPEEAGQKLGTTVVDPVLSGLAVIPTPGANEALCYEFMATGRDGHKLLLYINALTGAEEQILLLIETENGVLTV